MVTMASQESSPSKYLKVSVPADYDSSISPRTESTSLSSKMRKMLSSPKVVRGKPVISPNKTFGVPLEFLFERDKQEVPLIVTRICDYLKTNGLKQEGLFRVNGNMKVVDRLKTAFDKCGDADLEEIGDVPACASLLKMFLRELTDAVIPEDLQPLFISVQDQFCKEKQKSIPLIKELIKRMPRLNACVLKYLCEFMTIIAQESDVNKMTFLALAIVFGPNIFRCGEGLEGLKDQAYVNAILLTILQEYEELFINESKDKPRAPPEKPTPYLEHMRMKKDSKDNIEKPTRPPPPSLNLDDAIAVRNEENLKTPVKTGSGKRISKRKSPKSSPRSESAEGRSRSAKKKSPSKKEPAKCGSPTQTHFSSPLSRHLVDSTINTTVKEHLFGPGLVTSSIESDTFDETPLETSESGSSFPSIKERMKKFNTQNDASKTRAKSPDKKSSKVKKEKSKPLHLDLPNEHNGHASLTDDDLEYLEGTSSGTLESLTSTRVQPPKDRRKPSFVTKGTRSSSYRSAKSNAVYDSNEYFENHPDDNTDDSEEKEEDIIVRSHDRNYKHNRHVLLKSNSVPQETTFDYQEKPAIKKSNSAESLVPALDLNRLQDDNEEAQRSSRERFDGLYQGPMRSPHSSAPNSPRLVEKRHEVWTEKRQDTVPIVDMSPQELRKRITAHKKIISNFENNFEEMNGRKPRPSEKGHIQKYIAELGRAKKQLKELMSDYKENPELLNDTAPMGPDLGTAPNLREVLKETNEEPTKEGTLQNLLRKLEDKRLNAGRPHEMNAMTSEQLKEEKLAVQKALLQYENAHGRPISKEDKTLMRPIYDRYRKIKRRIATGKIDQSPSKQSIVSNIYQDDDIKTPDKSHNTRIIERETTSTRVPPILTSDTFHETSENNYGENADGTLGDTFSVTRHFQSSDTPEPYSPIDDSPRSLDESVLHDATIGELLEQQRTTRRVKKKLGKLLKEYEEEFFHTWHRKMQKEDRLPKEAEYREYKLVKAKLKLVEALIAKKTANNTV